MKEPSPGSGTSRSGTMDNINIAIVGANGAGKTFFLQRALRMPHPPNQSILTFTWTDADGSQYTANTFEIDLEAFDLEMNEPIRWPRQANGQYSPKIDGTIVLYDVTNKDSINLLPQTLCKFRLEMSGLAVRKFKTAQR